MVAHAHQAWKTVLFLEFGEMLAEGRVPTCRIANAPI
jgi:hypothetical protein